MLIIKTVNFPRMFKYDHLLKLRNISITKDKPHTQCTHKVSHLCVRDVFNSMTQCLEYYSCFFMTHEHSFPLYKSN